MGSEKKKFYEKPVCVDSGKVASVLGAVCSDGTNAGLGECVDGFNPTSVYTCQETGALADNDCNNNGSNAGSNCVGDGVTAANWACEAGGVAKYG